jgi:hypothetical protein
MKPVRSLFIFVTLVLVAACNQSATNVELAPQAVVTYQTTAANFPSPERGFYKQYVGWDKTVNPTWEHFPNLTELRQLRYRGMTLLRVYYVIPEFRGTSLSSEFLTTLSRQLETARRGGFKVIPLFAYSFPTGADWNNPAVNQDAPVATILTHLDNLKATLQANADVIAFWDAGFIGPWGEWHSSANGLLGNVDRYDGANEKTRQIVNKLLEVVPRERMISLRYVRHKVDLFGTAPLTKTEAFRGAGKARIGAKNDCFLASNDDWGTYYPNDPASIQNQKDFLHQDNLFVPQGGETCNFAEDAQPYIDCPNALQELAYMRFSTLNVAFEENVLQGWKNGGCYDQIARRFGYRFELVSASIPASVSKSSNLVMSFNVKNVGFASPYNPRGLELILRNRSTKQEFRIVLHTGSLTPTNHMYDPRFWQPGTTTKVSVNRVLPSTLPVGSYDLLLHLPDPGVRLRARSAYAIRFANVGTWESVTGFNSLLQSLTVTQ